MQGVRPVFSSVIDILETNLSKLLFQALTGGHTRVSMDYDSANRRLLAEIGDTTIEVPFVGRLDRVRERNVRDLMTNIAVHEAGHAVAYITLFGLSPLQLTSKVTSSYAASFMFPHEIVHTREAMVAKAKVYLAGGLAEEIVFGAGNATIGRSDDRESVTQLILDYLRRYGFDERFQATYTLDGAYFMERAGTDLDAEKMIGRLVSETTQLLLGQKPFLLELSKRLRDVGEMSAADVAVVAQEFGLTSRIEPEGHQHMPAFASHLPPDEGASALTAPNGSKPASPSNGGSRRKRV